MFGTSRRRLVGVTAGSVLALIATTAATNSLADTGGPGCQEFFVSPAGDDQASGTERDPWQTIERARDHIREEGLNHGRMLCDITVNLRAGDYVVEETIEFGAADSGTGGHSIVYRSYDGPGEARFLGAKPVTGWKKYDGNIYRTQVDKDELFYTLFEDHQRATTARTPNRQAEDEWAPYFVSTNPDPARWNTPKWLTFEPGDWDPEWEPEWGDLSDAQVVVWSGNDWVWFTDTVPIQNMSWGNNMTTLRYATRYPMTSDEGGSRYFIQNSLHFLDQPGEYYLDWKDGSLYYWPRSGSLSNSTVWAPTVKTVFDFSGDSPADRVHDVHLAVSRWSTPTSSTGTATHGTRTATPVRCTSTRSTTGRSSCRGTGSAPLR
ncbi:hypothetical protein ABN034_24975 [Actinopolymorpha sp. B11F2]|uniref:hypothetical protein n=1 Tax=Actinopolymorpha sp. B11F2 TaxID=3160862 RepID=UPI0032E45219